MKSPLPKLSDFKIVKSTLAVILVYLSLMVLVSCIENIDSDPFGSCPDPVKGMVKNIEKVFYGPYENGRYADPSDVVAFKDFTFNLELNLEKSNEASLGFSFPGRAYALSCVQLFDVKNLSNIAVILTAPYDGIQTGTDISYLFFVNNGNKRLSEFRDFSKMTQFLGLKLEKAPSTNSQLKTKTVLYLRDGTQKTFESTSPTITSN